MTERSLDAPLAALITDRIVYFPIRHHSPACARYLERIIRTRKPQTILIEGPASFTSLIPLVLHPKTKTPFAIYTSFVSEEPETRDAMTKAAALLGPPRHAAYYPFCDYSPELVALRERSRRATRRIPAGGAPLQAQSVSSSARPSGRLP